MNSSSIDKALNGILKEYWGHDQFRSSQYKVIRAVCAGKDTLAVLPTGVGKSICFQLPTLYNSGLCLVISPLIALMNDQVKSLKKKGVKAECLHSNHSTSKIDQILDNAIYGNVKFLYLSPERLRSHLVLERIKKMKICLIAVDEAHCISQWGHDFRPAYRLIANLRTLVKAPIIAVTATAKVQVASDICENLELQNPFIEVLSPRRNNIDYKVKFSENKSLAIVDELKGTNDSSILYVNNRRATKELAQFFSARKISAASYHAGLNKIEKERAQLDWEENRKQLIIATSAFGMGVDKSNVRNVFHIFAPGSLEEYIQEAGRAGRDGLNSQAIFYYDNNTINSKKEEIEKKFPSIDIISKVYQQLCINEELAEGSEMDYFGELNFAELSKKLKINYSVIFNACQLLELAELLELSEYFENPSSLILNQEQIVDYIRLQKPNDPLVVLIRSLLRQYEGLYFDYVKIKEKDIALKLKKDEKEIKSLLAKIKHLGIGDYHHGFSAPSFRISYPRINSHELQLPAEIYKIRKKRLMENLEVLEGYVKTQSCRQLFIEEYFGIQGGLACENCDNCRNNNQNIQLTPESILTHIPQGGISHKDLSSIFSQSNTDELNEFISKLIDEELISFRSNLLHNIKGQ